MARGQGSGVSSELGVRPDDLVNLLTRDCLRCEVRFVLVFVIYSPRCDAESIMSFELVVCASTIYRDLEGQIWILIRGYFRYCKNLVGWGAEVSWTVYG